MSRKNSCVTCDAMVHPDYRVKIDEFNDLAYKCLWCHTGKKHITLVDEKTNEETYLSKRECVEAYQKYLNKLTQDPKIRKLMFQGKDNPLDELRG